jgi:hypothetical protein
MTELTQLQKLRFNRTKEAVLWTSVLNEPLLTLYALFAFILHKDLGASALQIGLLTMLKPMVSLLSMYWSALIARRPDRILANVVSAGILSRLSFFFFPFIDSPWILIASVVIYMMLSRGSMPAWVEILKMNLPGKNRSTIYSWGSAIGYIEGVVIAIGVGYLLDHYHEVWRYLFPISAFIGILGVILQARIPIEVLPESIENKELSFKEHVKKPWIEAFSVLKENKSFRDFQWGVMFCGFGIMVIQPALPLFFVNILGLSYTDLAIALSIWKGIGYSVTSPFWGKGFVNSNIYKFSSLIFVFMGLFPLLLLFAPIDHIWVYIAYLAYGVGSAGCHLSWNLSGPHFAQGSDSSTYSSINILMVGVRGSFIPPIGSLLCIALGPVFVLALGASFCFFSGILMNSWSKKLALRFKPQSE